MREPVLEVRQLVMVYPGADAPALNGVDFTVFEGEIFGLLGPNGAGKTTAISVICTLLRPTGGRVFLYSLDTADRPYQVRRTFGLAPQEVALYPSLTARENLRYFGRLYGIAGRALEGRIDECLTLVGLDAGRDTPIGRYSGGMKRRANLAAAILHSPRILFLDEPTVGIDAQSRNFILGNIAALKTSGTTIVYTTHYMEEAEQICDRVAFIDKGRIIAEGPTRALIEGAEGCPNLEALFLRMTGTKLRD